MKKIISVMLLSALLLTGNVTYAQAATLSSAKTNITQSVSDYKAKLAELTPLLQTIRSNRTQIIELRANARNAYNKAKSHIKDLKQNKENLTSEQIQAIKDSLNVLKQDKQVLGDTMGDIAHELPDLRTARRDKNIEKVKSSLNTFIGVQNTRITELQKIIDDLNKISNL